MLLWASKFTTAKIECYFEMGKWIPLGVPFILLAIVQYTNIYGYSTWWNEISVFIFEVDNCYKYAMN